MGSEGSLTVVGTGIQLGQMSLEAVSHLREADEVFYLTTDPVTSDYIEGLNEGSRSLHGLYSPGKERLATYLEMAERILDPVRAGRTVCAAFYGHPGVFVLPSHVAVRRARGEGYVARMLPSVSAEDCLFSDLGVDPGALGCQSFEATDFVVNHREYDPTSHLVVWQIGVIGDIGYREEYSLEGVGLLVSELTGRYPHDHTVVIYEAARYSICEPRIDRVPLAELGSAEITPISTLYVPPCEARRPDAVVLERLGIPASYVQEKEDALLAGRS